MGNIHEYSLEYYQSHITLLCILIMLWWACMFIDGNQLFGWWQHELSNIQICPLLQSFQNGQDSHCDWIGLGLAWTKSSQCLHICTITLKKRAFSLARSLVLTHSTCLLKSILPLSFQLESLNILVLLQHLDVTLMNPLWIEYDKLLVKVLSYRMDAN